MPDRRRTVFTVLSVFAVVLSLLAVGPVTWTDEAATKDDTIMLQSKVGTAIRKQSLTLAPTEAPTDPVTEEQIGKGCWVQCRPLAGLCDYCGPAGACCRKGWGRNPEECQDNNRGYYDADGTLRNGHICVAAASPTTTTTTTTTTTSTTTTPYTGARRSNVHMLKDFISDPYRAWWRDEPEPGESHGDGRLGAPECHSLIDHEAIGAEIYRLLGVDESYKSHGGDAAFGEQLDKVKSIIEEGVIRAVESYQWTPMIVALTNDTENLGGSGCCGQLSFDGDTVPPDYELIKNLFVPLGENLTGNSLKEWIYPECVEDNSCPWEGTWKDFDTGGVSLVPDEDAFKICNSGHCALPGQGRLSDPDSPHWYTVRPSYAWELAAGNGRNCNPTIIDTRDADDRPDRIFLGQAMSLVNTGSGNDFVHAGIPCDRENRGDDPLFVFLGEGDDTYINKEGVAHVWGEAGDDKMSNSYWAGTTFDGGPGNDWLGIGSSGRGLSNNNVAIGGTGDDFIDCRGGFHTTRYTSYGGSGDDVMGNAYGTGFADLGSGDDNFTTIGPSVVLGGTGNDNMKVMGQRNGLHFWDGGEGDDYMQGHSNHYMVLFGGPGNDYLQGGRSAILAGGDGHDEIMIYGAHDRAVVVLEPGVDNVDVVTWGNYNKGNVKFDVSEFGFANYNEVLAAGLNDIQEGDEFVEFTLTASDGRHVVVKIKQTASRGRWRTTAGEFNSDKFIYADYAGQPAFIQIQMLSSDGPSILKE